MPLSWNLTLTQKNSLVVFLSLLIIFSIGAAIAVPALWSYRTKQSTLNSINKTEKKEHAIQESNIKKKTQLDDFTLSHPHATLYTNHPLKSQRIGALLKEALKSGLTLSHRKIVMGRDKKEQWHFLLIGPINNITTFTNNKSFLHLNILIKNITLTLKPNTANLSLTLEPL
jgi:hypothetical protein